ncbi:RNA polymerase sigma factor [Acanthopleuribacter pedis]|uniref:Sigma-70 family RNA polymerase sigma factor n=1 Tax=Acanthopleuribacter pedis TaxID=442870 RepID=A0A8J7U5I7_9BACT|nr:sigma-70 family RNA polymerase sigma factor [Acanthopleuribacter pedis]MBO1320894.1 sigma-70 family RNA polymerase sigma factor [Acanthopleuribacter pedis]
MDKEETPYPDRDTDAYDLPPSGNDAMDRAHHAESFESAPAPTDADEAAAPDDTDTHTDTDTEDASQLSEHTTVYTPEEQEIMDLIQKMLDHPKHTTRDILGLPRIADYLAQLCSRQLWGKYNTISFSDDDVFQDTILAFMTIPKSQIANAHHFTNLFRRKVRHTLLNKINRNARERRGGKNHRANLIPIDAENANKLAPDARYHPGSFDLSVAVKQAMAMLREEDETTYRVAYLRYVEGRKVAEIAEITGLSPATVNRKLRYIKRFFERFFDI